jgi:Hemolysin-type calcium-binding repeat (2 copies).
MATFTGTSSDELITLTSVSPTVSRSPSGSFPGGDNDSLDGGGGNDTLDGGDGSDTLVGGTGNDLLNNHRGNDCLSGGDGDDTIRSSYFSAGDGNDTLSGGAGNDEINNTNGSGRDRLDGGDGSDTLYGSFAGSDTLSGGAGNDVLSIYGGAIGNHSLDGGLGSDTLSGGPGNDTLLGVGRDRLDAQGGDDLIVISGDVVSLDGGQGNDTGEIRVATWAGVGRIANVEAWQVAAGVGRVSIEGTDGADSLDFGNGVFASGSLASISGGGGNDTVIGSAGGETIDGGAGNDEIQGGEGNDVFVFRPSEGNDTITDFTDGADLIDVSGHWRTWSAIGKTAVADGVQLSLVGSTITVLGATLSTLSESDFIGLVVATPTTGDDWLLGIEGADTLDGLAGNDTIRSFDGDNSLTGGLGNDSIEGGRDNDILDGSDGDDTIDGGAGNDTCFGGDGNDRIIDTNLGLYHQDIKVMDGGAGDDWLTAYSISSISVFGGSGDDTIECVFMQMAALYLVVTVRTLSLAEALGILLP